MKKAIVIISYILLATIMVSCVNTANLDGTKENDLPPESSKEYIIYSYPSAGGSLNDEQGAVDITFKDAETKIFSFAGKTEIEKPRDADNQLTFQLNGETYSLEYSRSYETKLSSSNKFNSYSKFNTYRSDDIYADTRASTNELLLFINFDKTDLKATGDLTEDEAKRIAESTILSLYGEDVKNEYIYATTVYTDSQSVRHYTVVHRKYVWGTPTNDEIQISVNMRGEVVGINAKNLGLFSHAEEQVEKKAIADAISVLEKTYSNNWSILAKTLILDSEGDYYIYAQLARKNTDGIDALGVYINVV